MASDFYQGRRHVYVERFTSNSDLMETCKGRKPLFPNSYDTYTSDHFSDKTIDMYGDSWSGGYKNNHELIRAWLDSKVDDKKATDVGRFTMECTATSTEKLTRRVYRNAGGAVAMGRFMAGEPQCMVAVVRQQVKSKVLDLAVDVGVSANVSTDTISALGQILAGAVAQLESIGYNMRVHALHGVLLDNRDVILANVLIKDVRERFNPDKMLFTLADPGYVRGIMFGWIVRNPHFDDSDALGYPLYADYTRNPDGLKKLYKKATGLDTVLNMQELAREYSWTSGTEQERIKKMRDKIVKQLTN